MAKVLVPGVNLNETKPWDGEANMLPPGEYAFEVVNCTLGTSSNNNPQLEFDLTVVAGADSEAYNGAKKKHWVVITDKSAGRVRNIVDACGVSMEADGSFDSDAFIGTQFIAEVFEDSWDKPDLASGTSVTKTNSKLRKERSLSAGWGDTTGTVAPAQPAQPAAPAAKAPAARAPAPAAATPPGPRLASSLPRPGQRAPIPGRRS